MQMTNTGNGNDGARRGSNGVPVTASRKCGQQFCALMKKNATIKRREWKATLMEILIPVALVSVVAILRTVVDRDIEPDQLNLAYKWPYSFDDALRVGWMLKMVLVPQYRIAFAPDNSVTRSLAASFQAAHAKQFMYLGGRQWSTFFDTEQQLVDYCKSTGYPDDRGIILFGVVVNQWDTVNHVYDYDLRMNATIGRRSSNVGGSPQIEPETNDFQISVDLYEAYTYRYFGWLDWQYHIDQTILNITLAAGNSSYTAPIGANSTLIEFTPMPTHAHIDDKFANTLANLIGFLYCLAFVWPVTKIVAALVAEKEMRIKEGMKMMGLSETALFCSYFTTYIISFAFTGLFCTLVTLDVYKNSTKGFIFVFFWIYGVGIFFFTYLMSTFFSKARTASTFTALIYLGLFFVSFVFTDTTPGHQKRALSIFFPVAMGLGAVTIGNFESVGGMNRGSADSEYMEYSYNQSVGYMILDCAIYFVLALYFNLVMPNDTGVSQKWYFCCSPNYWCPSTVPIDDSHDDHPLPTGPFLEASPKHLKAGVKIRGLRKEFPPAQSGKKNFVAVDGLDMDLYEGQILSLLGHNGAGKTTTISMLTGLTPVTSGDATINGLSLRNSLETIRPSLGVCPQHDILFDLLTVSEHLTMYAAIKGIPDEEIPTAVKDMIALVGLIEKTNTQSASLSGGQKRKLSVGIALLGDSKVVFLDEPTSGMDPYSRRWTWNLLKQKKKGRVIVLTTHFMDEADYLGDRIAIMAKGKVQCCGSSLFLKSKYGVGYTFTVSKAAECKTETLTKTITQRVSKAEVLSNAGTEISYQLPLDAADTFPAMFDELDHNGKALGVESYGISVTTLEEVFLRVGHAADHDEESEQQPVVKEEKQFLPPPSSNATAVPIKDTPVVHSTPDPASFTRQLGALLIKRLQHIKRDSKSLMWQIGYPVLILVFGILILKIAGAAIEQPQLTLSVNTQFVTPTPVPLGYASDITDVTNAPSYLTPMTSLQSISVDAQMAANITDFATYLVNTALTSGNKRYGAIYVNGPALAGEAPLIDEHYTVFINTTAMHSLPTYFNILNSARLQHACLTFGFTTSTTASVPRIITNNHPLPLTAKQSALFDATASLAIGIAFAFVPASVVGWIVKERQSKVKHLQIISGVSTKAYWVSTWLWDFMTFMIPCSAAMIIFLSYNLSALIAGNSGATIIAMILYSSSITSFTYCCSFLFDNHSTAQNVMLLVYILTGSIFNVVIYVLATIDSTKSAAKILRWVFRFIPNYAFCEIIQNELTRETPAVWGESKGLWSFEITGAPMLYLACETVVYFSILLVIEKILASPDMVAKLFSTPILSDTDIANEAKMNAEEDEDIVAERKRILQQVEKSKTGGSSSSSSSNTKGFDMISVQGMRKVYNGRFGAKAKCAVKNLYFGVPEGQCFGFLGINGAGKTTTLRMLSGDELPTKGTSYLHGLDIMTHQEQVRRLIGYCPQFDALIDTLTSREHLALFARIKGVPEHEIPRLVTELLDKLTLTQYADRPCGGYSGGNKRKLCVGLSLIGHPPIVFLDEPSTGMDPGSRRFMWNLISTTMKGRSVILTTHSMEECEALCQRIGIMVSGRLKCIGSANHLRQRYGHGYQLDLNVPIERVNAVKEFVLHEFSGSQVLEHHDSNVKFRIRKGDRSLGTIFRIMNNNRKALGITEYSVSEATLEQIFIRFARQQEEELAQAEGIADATLLQIDGDDGHDAKRNGASYPTSTPVVPYLVTSATPTPLPSTMVAVSSQSHMNVNSTNGHGSSGVLIIHGVPAAPAAPAAATTPGAVAHAHAQSSSPRTHTNSHGSSDRSQSPHQVNMAV